jgi:hypothetical protein
LDVKLIDHQKSYNSMEKVVSNTKSQFNSPNKNSKNKDKEIEEAIQKAIDTETLRKSKI